VKLHILSDLHLEFAPLTPLPVDADVVVLAGDIDVGVAGVQWARAHFDCPVVYVAGNHEYYGGHFRRTLAKMKRCAAGTQVHVLDAEELVLDGVRFLGTTLWTDFALIADVERAMASAVRLVNDYTHIGAGVRRRLRPEDVLSDHRRSRVWIELNLANPFPGPTVVVTHHLPSAQSIPDRFQFDPVCINPCYASHLDHLLGPPVSLWIHGHTHDSFDYRQSGTRVVCNPRGYVPMEINPRFDPGLVVEV
jgi:predicted phosphodiesterase